MTTNFPEVLPHSAIEEVFPNLFMVRGSFQMAPLVTITRNMFILRNSDGELTLINSVRLSDVGEAALGKLGEVKHLIRIGAFHDRDDPYFVHRYKPTFWALPGTRHSLDITADAELKEGGELPIEGASLFVFKNARFPECALRLEDAGGTLVTCDSVQNIVETDGFSPVGKVVTRLMGFLRPAGIGGPWRKAMSRKEGPPLADDFQRLMELPFENVLSAHGPPHTGDVKADLRRTMEKVFTK